MSSTALLSFTNSEIDSVADSLQRVAGLDSPSIDWDALRELIKDEAHKSHKDWDQTESAASRLASILKGPDDLIFRRMFSRVLEDGNWEDAAVAASKFNSKPWIVLVTGVNGIRKTTSVYQDWLKQALYESLGDTFTGSIDELPDGRNSFFRQLDYMIATLANIEFQALYEVTQLEAYSARKAEIFTRYRTLSEMLGILLVREAQGKGMNIMVETSGRDIAMFKYIDYLFPDSEACSHRKMVVHFTINDIAYAERSVDARMAREMSNGQTILQSRSQFTTEEEYARAVIQTNQGGPYGSSVLRGVQADSQAVWAIVRHPFDSDSSIPSPGQSWLKAHIEVVAGEGEWSARAVVSEDKAGTATYGASHVFTPPTR